MASLKFMNVYILKVISYMCTLVRMKGENTILKYYTWCNMRINTKHAWWTNLGSVHRFLLICTEISAGIYEFLYTCGKGGSIEYLNIKVCLLRCILFSPSYMCQIHGTFWQGVFFCIGKYCISTFFIICFLVRFSSALT